MGRAGPGARFGWSCSSRIRHRTGRGFSTLILHVGRKSYYTVKIVIELGDDGKPMNTIMWRTRIRGVFARKHLNMLGATNAQRNKLVPSSEQRHRYQVREAAALCRKRNDYKKGILGIEGHKGYRRPIFGGGGENNSRVLGHDRAAAAVGLPGVGARSDSQSRWTAAARAAGTRSVKRLRKTNRLTPPIQRAWREVLDSFPFYMV